jgi:hypothetical protein
MYYSGITNVPGAPGNLLANQGPSTPVKFDERMNQLVPTLGGGGIKKDSVRWKNLPTELPQAFGMFTDMQIAGSPSFDIQRGPGALGGRSEEQIRRLQQNLPENQQLLEEFQRRGITPGGGPKLPLAGTSNLNSAVANMTPGAPGNFAGFYGGPQIGQAPVGFAAKTVYS